MATMTLAPTHITHPHSGGYNVTINPAPAAAAHHHYYPSHSVMEDSDEGEDVEEGEDEEEEDEDDEIGGHHPSGPQHHQQGSEGEDDDQDAIQNEIEASHQYYVNHPNAMQAQQQQHMQQQQLQQQQQYGYQTQYTYQQQQQQQQQHQQILASQGLDDHDGLEDEEVYSDDDGSSIASIPDENIDFSLIYALHTFLATVEGQASVVKGDSLLLLDDANSYWWLVRVLKTEDVGYIPAENVETPFERLARLNKHRNIEVALATLEDKAAAGGPRGNVVDGVRERDGPKEKEKERKGLLSWSKKKAEEDNGSRRVIFAPPTYVDHPGVTWSSDEEDEEGDEDEDEDEDDEEIDDEDEEHDGAIHGDEIDDGRDINVSSRGKEMDQAAHVNVQGYDLEPDDGVEWANDAVEAQRMENEHAIRAQQQQMQYQHQLQQQHQQQQQQQRSPESVQIAPAMTTPEPGHGQSRPIPTTIVTPSTPQTSSSATATSPPVTSPETTPNPINPSTSTTSPPFSSRNPFAPNYSPPSTTSLSRSTKPLRYPSDFSLPLVTSLARARALSAQSATSPAGHRKSMSLALPFHLLDDVQRELYGERAEMDGIHPEIRSCFATLCARMDAWDREVDEIIGSVGVIGGIVQEQSKAQHHQQQQRRYSQRIGVI